MFKIEESQLEVMAELAVRYALWEINPANVPAYRGLFAHVDKLAAQCGIKTPNGVCLLSLLLQVHGFSYPEYGVDRTILLNQEMNEDSKLRELACMYPALYELSYSSCVLPRNFR